MWNILVLVAMTAIGGFYSIKNGDAVTSAEQLKAETLAESMAVYRQAVIRYYSMPANHALTDNSVPFEELKTSGALPSWSTMSDQQTTLWNNYRAADGMIYIFPAAQTPVDISSEIMRLAGHNVLAGVYRRGDLTLHSPLGGNLNTFDPNMRGDTQIPIPASIRAAIPIGSPVWVAVRK